MKKLILFALMGALFSLSCSRNDEVKPVGNGRYLTIKASMPNDNNMTRAFAGKKDAGYTDYSPLIFRWRDGDEIKVLLEQDGVREFQTTQATNVTNEGKNAEFKIDLQSFDDSEAINVICAFGDGVSIDGSNGNITINTPTDKVTDLDKRIAIYSKETLAVGAKELSLVFRHLYAYVCLRVQNVGHLSYRLPVGTTGFKLRAANSTNWLYSGTTSVDLSGDTPSPSGSTSNSLVFFTKPNNIVVGEIAEFWGAFVPVDVATPAMQVSAEGSSNAFTGLLRRKSGGGNLKAGNVYYISSRLSGSRLTFGDKSVLDESRMPSMIRFTTTKNVGEKVSLLINAEQADQAGVWIDLNNNGVKDSGEEVKTFGLDPHLYKVSYTLGAREVTIYGKVTTLGCDGNQLTSLDVSKNMKLIILGCDGNQLTSLDVSKNVALERLGCDGNQLTSLDVSKNMKLIHLSCSGTGLTSLDVSKNVALENLYCNYNGLTFLNVSKNVALIYLKCYGNQLSTLDVSHNVKLKVFECNSNHLTSLDVSNNVELKFLACNNNNLTSLDVTWNVVLDYLNCRNNSNLKEIYVINKHDISRWTRDYNAKFIVIRYL